MCGFFFIKVVLFKKTWPKKQICLSKIHMIWANENINTKKGKKIVVINNHCETQRGVRSYWQKLNMTAAAFHEKIQNVYTRKNLSFFLKNFSSFCIYYMLNCRTNWPGISWTVYFREVVILAYLLLKSNHFKWYTLIKIHVGNLRPFPSWYWVELVKYWGVFSDYYI